ncbi:MAG: hypothetical protein RMK35_04250 [Aquificaceae bacterium]|nr:hypothetical protein [Aquificaceae bacterium]
MLITLECIEGSGKRVQAIRLYKHSKIMGYEVFLHRNPWSTALAEKIRDLILNFETNLKT